MPLSRVGIWSPNYSSRGGATVSTVVLHTAEGARSYTDLGNFFANPASGVSSHVGIDDSEGVIGEYVQRGYKAWTASNANPWSIQAELCAFASWSAAEWDRHPVMLENTAAWIAEEASYFGIPITLLDAHQAQDPYCPGICQHNDLGSMGGGHWDCGPDFPIDRVLDMARGGIRPQPEPEDDSMPVWIMRGDRDLPDIGVWAGTVYLVSQDLPSGKLAAPDEHWLADAAARSKVLAPPKGARTEVTNGVTVEVVNADFLRGIPTVAP